MFKLKKYEIRKLISPLKSRMFPYIAGLLGCSIVDASVPMVTAVMIKNLADATIEKQMPLIINSCIGLGITLVVLCIITPLFTYLFTGTVKKIMKEVQLKVFNHIVRIPVNYFDNTHSGDSIARITNDISKMENAYTGNLREILSLLITGIISSVIMLLLDWRVALGLIFVGILTTWIGILFAVPIRKLSDKIQNDTGTLVKRLIDLLSGFSIIKMFHIEEKILKKYNKINCGLADTSIKLTAREALLDGSNVLFNWISNSGTIIILCILIMHGQSTFGTAYAMVILQEYVTSLFRQLGGFVARLQTSLAGAARVFEIMGIPVESEKPSPASKLESPYMLEIRNGTFCYNEGECVIDGLNLEVEEGKIAALVGPSGGGKSTIVKLLMKFYPLTAGDIFIKNRSMPEYSLTALRDLMAYVPQDAYLFAGTIADNIRYGCVNASSDAVVEAARQANAHEFIMEQEKDYSTLIGERGVKLSGGQKQRIAIARALLKNAPILLLDEATSALDSESEQLIQNALNILMKGRTTLVVAHRLSTIEHADVIYVIDKGRVIESGKHGELLAREGLYSNLYKIQFKQAE